MAEGGMAGLGREDAKADIRRTRMRIRLQSFETEGRYWITNSTIALTSVADFPKGADFVRTFEFGRRFKYFSADLRTH
jgi:hypothetical protein